MYQKLEMYSPLLLKIALIFLAFPALFLFGFIGYNVVLGLVDGLAPWFLYPVYILVMAAAALFTYTLVPSFQVVLAYEKNALFTEETYQRVHQIMSRLFIITVIFFIQLPYWFIIAQWDDAPGLILIMSYVMGIAFTLTLLAALCKRILAEKINLK
ncbi:MAG: DUF2975 domain-containing protein [Candidatus Izemoplasma sp.]|nr:DUF2975 domain-containing protein [Candidatus Izemoplasma sp.]